MKLRRFRNEAHARAVAFRPPRTHCASLSGTFLAGRFAAALRSRVRTAFSTLPDATARDTFAAMAKVWVHLAAETRKRQSKLDDERKL